MLDFIKNNTIFANKYHVHSEAIIISCYFNPQGSTFRLAAFEKFYESIKHMNHMIIECVIGDSHPQLKEREGIKRVYTESLLWHKESLLNKIVDELPEKYKYIFWVDADVIFTNKNWLTDGVKQLQENNIIQPFEYCVHLDKYETKSNFDSQNLANPSLPNLENNKVWRSFCANHATTVLWQDENYNNHGHVGFAWGARREVLDAVPLYDRALIGGADHIICHAAVGQIPHKCITKSFTDNIDEVNEWSRKFYHVVRGKIGYVKGDLYHIWHGDIAKREYLKRIQDFTVKTKDITKRDSNGLHVSTKKDEAYVHNYFKHREAGCCDDGFIDSLAMGYLTDSAAVGFMAGGNLAGAMIGDMLNNDDDIVNQDIPQTFEDTADSFTDNKNDSLTNTTPLEPFS